MDELEQEIERLKDEQDRTRRPAALQKELQDT